MDVPDIDGVADVKNTSNEDLIGKYVKAKVVETNESTVYNNGLLKQGSQVCMVELLQGNHKGKVVEAVNFLNGKLEFDKMFVPGDKALVLVEQDEQGNILFVNMLDHYRLNVELLIVLVFMLSLIHI